MKSIRIAPSDFQQGLKQWSRELRNDFKSYLWLEKAFTLPLQTIYENPGLVIARLAMQKIEGYKR